MMKHRKFHTIRAGAAISALGLVGLLAPSFAQASPMTFSYGGVITSADASTGVMPGASFSGSFTYDPAGAYMNTSNGTQNSYQFGDPSMPVTGDQPSLRLAIGDTQNYSILGGLNEQVNGEDPSKGIGAGMGTSVIVSNMGVDPSNPLMVQLALTNPDRSVYGSLAPVQSLSLSDFPSATMTVSEGGKMLFSGNITSLSPGMGSTSPTMPTSPVPGDPTPTPEPSTLALLGVAGLGYWFRSRKRIGRARA